MPILHGQVVPGLGPLIDIWVGPSGPLVQLLRGTGQQIPLPVRVRGLIDTGATGTCIDEQVIAKLGIAPRGIVAIHTPSTGGTAKSCYQYDVGLVIDDPAVHVVRLNLPIIASSLKPQGIEALIGRDVLDDTTFFYNGPGGAFVWSI